MGELEEDEGAVCTGAHDSTPVITLPELCSLFAPEPPGLGRGEGEGLPFPAVVIP
jgi:hypothetical protein